MIEEDPNQPTEVDISLQEPDQNPQIKVDMDPAEMKDPDHLTEEAPPSPLTEEIIHNQLKEKAPSIIDAIVVDVVNVSVKKKI